MACIIGPYATGRKDVLVDDIDDSRIERYSTDSDSWFLAYCKCECGCPNQQTKVRERKANGLTVFWCTFCFKTHRAKSLEDGTTVDGP